jgi:hypothetical protein
VTALLVKAAEDAADAAARLERADIDPATPLAAFLQPLRDTRVALDWAGRSEWHLARMAADLIPDTGLAGSAEAMLKQASRRADSASDRIDRAIREIRRILQRAGDAPADTDGYPGSRLGQAARTASISLEYFSSVAEQAVNSPALSLLAATLAAQRQADALASLAVARERLRPAVLLAYDRLPRGLNLKAELAANPVRLAAGTLKKAAVTARRATSEPMQEAINQERKRASA